MKIESFENWLKAKNNGGSTKLGHHFKEVSDDGNRMLKNNLNDIIEYSTKLLQLLDESSQLEEWMENKITVARTYMSDVTHAYMNDIKDNPCGGTEEPASDAGYSVDDTSYMGY